MRALHPVLLPAIAILGCNEILGVEVRTLTTDGGAGGGGAIGGGAGGGDGGAAGASDCLLSCGPSCVLPSLSDEHCGRCDNACAAGQDCLAGACDRRIRSSLGSKGQCARGPNGLACWGGAGHGESGTGSPSTPDDYDPRQVVVLPEGEVPLFATSAFNARCVLFEGGAIRCFGSNLDGTLGIGSRGGPDDGATDQDCCYVAEAVSPALPDDEHFVDLAGAGDAQPGFFVALSEDGDVYCWGKGASTPTKLTTGIVQIVAGGSFACALDKQGDVWCWGSPWGVGPENEVCKQPMDKVEGLPPIRALGGGDTAGFAIGQDGTLNAWGDNRWGVLGPGFTVGMNHSPAPVQHVFPSPPMYVTGTNAATCALLENGDVYCWGENGHQGDGTPFQSQVVDPEPHRASIAGVSQLASSYTDFIAVDERGKLLRWSGFSERLLPTEVDLP